MPADRPLPWPPRWATRRDKAIVLGRASVLACVLTGLGGCGGSTLSVPGDGGAQPGGISDGPGDGTPQTADAIPRAEPRSRYGNPRSYVVRGKRYYTLGASEGFVERGIASWYGRKFHGRRTSSGETYDMYAMTAAHKSLPLPTYVRVTHLDNGRSVVVKVNDRGPFHQHRIIDLSYAAALKLGIVRNGTGPVQVVALNPATRTSASASAGGSASAGAGGGDSASRPRSVPVPAASARPPGGSHSRSGERRAAPAARTSQGQAPRVRSEAPGVGAGGVAARGAVELYLQLGAFSTLGNARAFALRVGEVDLGSPVISQAGVAGQVVYRVRMGPYRSTAQIDNVASRLASAGFADSVVVVEPVHGG